MLIGKPPDIRSSEITSESAYRQFMNRRRFLRGAVAAGAAAVAADRLAQVFEPQIEALADTKLQTVPSPLTTTGEQLTSLEDITRYNNFYEFGVNKGDPAKNAGGLPTRPWSVKVEGKVAKPLTFDIDDLLKLRPLEDRVYRMRCVEAWSMVIPWVGYSLSELIKQCNPLPSAKYVQFLSYYDRHVEKWANESTIYWPYSEGLRMDEAMNPLTLLTFGLYGQTLPNQDGAPVRVIIPWKYGFKSAKSMVTIKFVDKMPHTTWNDMAPNEYGFYSNVNPNVDHPRWSQKTERRIGLPFYEQRRTTLMFNGYSDQVASLYKGMNLRKDF
ncbi:MAG TPA: protein-methionine-sulfoxide reductase catalytic subunit MsrP [Terracidiphilus sp.]|jgi:sulfoxide reductase catalytic subunit YedY|nr:protein-methionine-sulfoxide reductase catalytic subunit MsrP [Terracidiphilus sp.]